VEQSVDECKEECREEEEEDDDTKISETTEMVQGPVPCLKLQVLKLTRNQLTGSIPVSLGRLTNLVTLELGSNKLTSIGNQTCKDALFVTTHMYNIFSTTPCSHVCLYISSFLPMLPSTFFTMISCFFLISLFRILSLSSILECTRQTKSSRSLPK
jgi:hypothetical protein